MVLMDLMVIIKPNTNIEWYKLSKKKTEEMNWDQREDCLEEKSDEVNFQKKKKIDEKWISWWQHIEKIFHKELSKDSLNTHNTLK